MPDKSVHFRLKFLNESPLVQIGEINFVVVDIVVVIVVDVITGTMS